MKNIKLKLASPIIDGFCHVGFADALVKLSKACSENSILFNYEFLTKSSIIQLARNDLVESFMSDASNTHMLMIDGDIGYDAKDILKLISLDKDVAGVPVSKKKIEWGKIKNVVLEKKQVSDQDLSYFGATVNFFPYQDSQGKNLELGSLSQESVKFEWGKPFRVAGMGTGLMLIKREVFEKMQDTYPELNYTYHDRKKFSYFEMTKAKNGNLLSEDLSFCSRVNEMGMDMWVYPWGETIHNGVHSFPSDFKKWF
jgi:hypothetical protein